jgi:hypothetical protein
MSINRPFRAAEKRNFGTVPGRMPGAYSSWHYGDCGNSGSRAVEARPLSDAVESEVSDEELQK